MKRFIFPALLSIVLVLNGCLSSDEPFDPNAQLEADIIAIDEYLAENNIDAEEHESGFRYLIEEMGDGPGITDSFRIILDYEGETLDGRVFDSDDDFYRSLNESGFPAWRMGLPLINEGGTITLFIPSGLAFGNISLEGLPANSNVIYRISVTNSDIRYLEEVNEINEYLAENNITAEVHESGLRYVIHEPGDPDRMPDSRGSILVAYEGRLLNDDVFDESDLREFDLTDLITGWRIGIPLIGEGGSISIYIPSRLAFGPQDLETIPSNSPLIFDVQLEAVR